jgi:hypothetical protein
MDSDKGLIGRGGPHNLEFACDHNKERYGGVSLLDEHFTTLNHTHMSMRCNTTNLSWR